MNKLIYPNIIIKQLRAKVIKKHLNNLGINKCVCFTCGNASKYLRFEGINVISVGKNELLIPNKWFSYTEIQNNFNNIFDATSGHLPMPLMIDIAKELRARDYGNLKKKVTYLVPTGSGESIICLQIAFPNISFKPVRLSNPQTEYNKDAPLNDLLIAMFGIVGDNIKCVL